MKISKLCEEYDYFFFDLDRTIWNTYDKYGNEIWAKQMLAPFNHSEHGTIIDDVGSKCVLHPTVKTVLEFLQLKNKHIRYLSCGAKFEFCQQPSVTLLNMFGMGDYFNPLTSKLAHKTFNKSEHFKDFGSPVVMFEDNATTILELKKNEKINVVDRYSFNSWSELL